MFIIMIIILSSLRQDVREQLDAQRLGRPRKRVVSTY